MRIFRYENFYRQLLAARSAETLLPVERVLHQFPFGKLRGDYIRANMLRQLLHEVDRKGK